MTYALIQNGAVAQYPYSFALLRKDNPQVSYPRDPSDARLAEFGVFVVAPSAKPAHDPITKNVLEATPVLVGGVWTQAWSIIDASAEEIAARQSAAALMADRAAAKADTFVASFLAMTPAQVETYVENNTATLATTRALLRKMALMLHILARREFGG
jgi:hypothetical protein